MNSYLEYAVLDVADIDLVNIFTHNKDTWQILCWVCGKQCAIVKVKKFCDHVFTNEYQALISSDTACHIASSRHKVVKRPHNAARTHVNYVLLTTQQIAN